MKLLRSTLSMLLTKEKEVRAVILNIDPITGDLIAQVNNERAIIAPQNITMYQFGDEDSQIKRLLGQAITPVLQPLTQMVELLSNLLLLLVQPQQLLQPPP